ncbi:MAG: hypothetical protein JWO36_3161 [Myxococcales bacterium]|nr:hypothetical protein [Myxococcales bacterium]
MSIEVSTGNATKQVELFIGNDLVADPASCTNGSACRIEPPRLNGTKQSYLGSGWTTRASRSDLAKVDNGFIRFTLEADLDHAGDQIVPALLIVGFDANANPTELAVLHDLVVPGASAVVVRTTLVPAASVVASADKERIQVWRRPSDLNSDLSACAVVGHADGTYEFFSPSDDTDCDGAVVNSPTAPECSVQSGWTWCGQSNARLPAADCVTPASGTCRLAGPQCGDSGPSCNTLSRACAPTEEVACLPREICDAIAAQPTPCNSLDANCLGPALTIDSPSVFCHTYYNGTTPCPGPTVDANALLSVLRGRTCDKLALAAVRTPFAIGLSVSLSASDTINLLPSGSDPCVQVVQLAGTGLAAPPFPLLLDVVTGPAPIQHRFVRFGFANAQTTDCTTVTRTCSVTEPTNYNYACQ